MPLREEAGGGKDRRKKDHPVKMLVRSRRWKLRDSKLFDVSTHEFSSICSKIFYNFMMLSMRYNNSISSSSPT
jgi:hypothetical protein